MFSSCKSAVHFIVVCVNGILGGLSELWFCGSREEARVNFMAEEFSLKVVSSKSTPLPIPTLSVREESNLPYNQFNSEASLKMRCCSSHHICRWTYFGIQVEEN